MAIMMVKRAMENQLSLPEVAETEEVIEVNRFSSKPAAKTGIWKNPGRITGLTRVLSLRFSRPVSKENYEECESC